MRRAEVDVEVGKTKLCSGLTYTLSSIDFYPVSVVPISRDCKNRAGHVRRQKVVTVREEGGDWKGFLKG